MHRTDGLKAVAALTGLGFGKAELLEVKHSDIALVLKTSGKLTEDRIIAIQRAFKNSLAGRAHKIPLFIIGKNDELSVVRREDLTSQTTTTSNV